MAFPSPATNGQTYTTGGYTYTYNSTLRTWTKTGTASSNIGGVQVGNATVTTGNTSVSNTGLTTGNTTVSSNSITTGNTSITGNTVTTDTITSNTITTGNTSITSNAITTGNTSITSNTITTNTISTGNTTITNTGVNVGNVTLSNTGVNVGNVAISNTGLTAGNTNISDTGVNVGNVILSNTGVNVGNVILSNTGLTTGNTNISDTGVNVGNVSLSNTGVNVGNVSLSNTGLTTGNTSITDTGVNVGNVSLSNTGVNVGNVSLSNTGVNVGNVTLSNTGLTTGNTSITNAGITANVANFVDLSANGNVTFSGPSVILGNVSNLHISGGSPDYVLSTDGSGNLTWVPNPISLATGNANVGGLDTQVQFNDGGSALSGSSSFTFNKTTGTLSITNITSGGNTSLGNVNVSSITSNLIPNANVTYDLGNNTNRFRDLYLSGNSIKLGNATLTANNTNLVVADGNVTANFFIGDGGLLSNVGGAAASKVFILSNISNIVVGSALDVTADYSNATYTGGVFTIEQLGPVSFSMTDTWQSTSSSSKNAYANFIASTVNTSNVTIVLTLANANFSIQSTDTLSFGSSVLTGANLLAVGITGTGGTYTIPNTYLTVANTQTNSSVSVSANLTTTRGVKTTNGTTLTNNQPVPFTISSLSGSFTSSSVPYWTAGQVFNWSAVVSSGATGITGNVTYSNTANNVSGTLTSSGATSGASPSIDCFLTYTLQSTDYAGTGGFGAGARNNPSTATGTVSAATKYYPLFWKITSNSTIPTFTTSDSRNSNNFAVGQGANTSSTASDYLWMATPNTTQHTFKHIFLGSDIVDTPNVTGTITISGQTYSVWGFTNFSQVANILTTS